MAKMSVLRVAGASVLCLGLAACGGGFGSGAFSGDSGLFQRGNNPTTQPDDSFQAQVQENTRQSTVWDLFSNSDNPNVTVEVNRYIWNASLEVLNFLPIESVDPFSGVIVTGFGTPPGGGNAYRATVYVQDPALDARSLRVALATRGGPVSAETQRAVEDAILTRARQLRIADGRL
jgi:hypothetical protein